MAVRQNSMKDVGTQSMEHCPGEHELAHGWAGASDLYSLEAAGTLAACWEQAGSGAIFQCLGNGSGGSSWLVSTIVPAVTDSGLQLVAGLLFFRRGKQRILQMRPTADSCSKGYSSTCAKCPGLPQAVPSE